MATTGNNTTSTNTTIIEDTDKSVQYSGNWRATKDRPEEDYREGTNHQTTSGGEAKISFTGSGITTYGSAWKDHDRTYCRIIDLDTTPWFWFNISSSTDKVDHYRMGCSVTGLPLGNHTLGFGVVTEDKGQSLNFDYAVVENGEESGNGSGMGLVWNSSFPLVAPPSNYANTTLLPTSSLPLSTSSSSSATSSATSSSSSASNSKSLGIGLGVGLGSALLLTLLAVFYYLRHRRRRAYALTATQDEPPKGDGKRKSGFTALDPTTPPPVPATIETEENPSTYHFPPTTLQPPPAQQQQQYQRMSVPEISEYVSNGGAGGGKGGTVRSKRMADGLEDPESFTRRE